MKESDPFISMFISHGAPTLALDEGSYTHAWEAMAGEVPKPRAILVVSAHWDTREPVASTAERPTTIYDFSGFPRELYEVRYPAPGAPDLGRRTAELLGAAGMPCELDAARGLDHGAWVPLKWMYPEADIPVAQLSVQSHRSARHHYEIGRALAPLRGEGVLIIASGGIVHNLRELDWHQRSPGPFAWAREFNDWISQQVAAGAIDAMLDYRSIAPQPARAHPTEEHFVPFFVALGAGGATPRRIELGFDLGSLGMDCYTFI